MADRDVAKAASAGRVTTVSTTYQDGLSLSWTPSAASKDYWLLGSAIIDGSSTGADVRAKVRDVTAGADLCLCNIEPRDTTDRTAVAFLAKWPSPGSPTSQNFKIQYSTETANTTTAGCAEMVLVAVESHADDEYVETDAETSTTSTSFQDAQTLTFTPATAGEYLIVAYGEVNNNAPSVGQVQLDIDGVASHLLDPLDLSDGTTYFTWFAVRKVSLTAASTIKIQIKSNGSSATRIRRRRILAIRLDTLRDNFDNYTAARGSTTNTSGSPVDAASVTFTAAGSVDYLAIGNVVIDSNSASISTNAVLSMDGAAAALHTREASASGVERAYAALSYAAFAAGSRTVRAQVYSETASVTTGYAWRGVYVLDLRETLLGVPQTYDDDCSFAVAAATGLAGQGVALAAVPFGLVAGASLSGSAILAAALAVSAVASVSADGAAAVNATVGLTAALAAGCGASAEVAAMIALATAGQIATAGGLAFDAAAVLDLIGGAAVAGTADVRVPLMLGAALSASAAARADVDGLVSLATGHDFAEAVSAAVAGLVSIGPAFGLSPGGQVVVNAGFALAAASALAATGHADLAPAVLLGVSPGTASGALAVVDDQVAFATALAHAALGALVIDFGLSLGAAAGVAASTLVHHDGRMLLGLMTGLLADSGLTWDLAVSLEARSGFAALGGLTFDDQVAFAQSLGAAVRLTLFVDGASATVTAQGRTYEIRAQGRQVTITAQPRTAAVEAEARTVVVTPQTRTPEH